MRQKTTHRILLTAFALILAVGLISAGSAAADAIQPSSLGTAFTYQGQLADSGNPAVGAYDFRFILYDALIDGSPVGGALLKDDIAVNKGLFTVMLDFGAGSFNGTRRFLEVEVRPGASTGNYTVLSPRQELTPTPYAFFADSAPWAGLTGVPAGFSDGIDNDTLYTNGTGLTLTAGAFGLAGSFSLPQTCSNGQLAAWNSATSLWVCANDKDTTYTNGTGLNLTSTTFSLDTTYTDSLYWKQMGVGGPDVVPLEGELYKDSLVVAWGRVTAGGALFGGFDFGVTAVDHNGTGFYHIELDQVFPDGGTLIPVVNPEVDLVDGLPPTGAANVRFAVINQLGNLGVPSNTFDVFIYDGNFALVDNDFTFIVVGRDLP